MQKYVIELDEAELKMIIQVIGDATCPVKVAKKASVLWDKLVTSLQKGNGDSPEPTLETVPKPEASIDTASPPDKPPKAKFKKSSKARPTKPRSKPFKNRTPK